MQKIAMHQVYLTKKKLNQIHSRVALALVDNELFINAAEYSKLLKEVNDLLIKNKM